MKVWTKKKGRIQICSLQVQGVQLLEGFNKARIRVFLVSNLIKTLVKFSVVRRYWNFGKKENTGILEYWSTGTGILKYWNTEEIFNSCSSTLYIMRGSSRNQYNLEFRKQYRNICSLSLYWSDVVLEYSSIPLFLYFRIWVLSNNPDSTW